MQETDLLIVGAGVSGRVLADRLAARLPTSVGITLVDDTDDPDYNISFWWDRDTPYEEIMSSSWRRIAVARGDERRLCPLERYRLRSFWRDDFDALLDRRLRARSNVLRDESAVVDMEADEDGVTARTTTGRIRARWAFDSRPPIRSPERMEEAMLMQGLAVELRSETAVFDPETATLFDFLLDSPGFDFLYVLPYEPTRALVNVAFVTPGDVRVGQERCERAIDDYLADRFGCQRYEITRRSPGRIPLGLSTPPRRVGARIVPIGVRGGMIKASSSYAFTRILQDAEGVSAAMEATGQPYAARDRAWYYRLGDRGAARLFHRSPSLAQDMMMAMFQPGSADLALGFLDERNDLAENGRLFGAIPRSVLLPFLGQLLRSLLPG